MPRLSPRLTRWPPPAAPTALLVGLAAALALPWLVLRGGATMAASVVAAAAVAAALVGRRAPRALWLAVVAVVPFTVTVAVGPHLALAVPLEPAMAVFALVALTRAPHRAGWGHPVTTLVLAHLAWLAVASGHSQEPLVSAKYLVARLAYVAVFFAAGLSLLAAPTTASGRQRWSETVIHTGSIPLAGVALWVLARQASHGWSAAATYTVAQPLFANHLEYAMAAVAWLLLAAATALATRRRASRIAASAVAVILLTAVATAGARSAWLALAAALLAATVVAARPRPQPFVAVVLTCGAVVGAAGWGFEQVLERQRLRQPQLTDRVVGDLVELDIVKGESSRERVNRWRAALAMARHRPLAGCGPGAYERQYGAYQELASLTPVSTFAGDRGDAHSEIATTVAEQGVVGLVVGLALLVAALATGARVVRQATAAASYWMGVGWTAAVVALAVGNAFNSFLELDELAPVTWLVLAGLVAADRPPSSTVDPLTATAPSSA